MKSPHRSKFGPPMALFDEAGETHTVERSGTAVAWHLDQQESPRFRSQHPTQGGDLLVICVRGVTFHRLERFIKTNIATDCALQMALPQLGPNFAWKTPTDGWGTSTRSPSLSGATPAISCAESDGASAA